MKKMKIVLPVILAVLLVAAGLWLYWEQDMPLMTLLPEGNWHIASLLGIEFHDGALEHVLYTVDEETEREIITALDAVTVNRCTGRSFAGFYLVLCSEEHDMVAMPISEDGQVSINDEYYYEGGEELYEYLCQLAKTLPVSN